MKQKTIATRHLRTKIAAGYVLILFVIFGIVYIWLNEQNRQQELEATTYKIRSLPQGCTRGIYEGSGFIHDW